MSDVIVVMRDGLIQQQGDPTELYERPVNRFVADFIGTRTRWRRRSSASTSDRPGRRRDRRRAAAARRRHRPEARPAGRRRRSRSPSGPSGLQVEPAGRRDGAEAGAGLDRRPGTRSTRAPISANRRSTGSDGPGGRAGRPAPERGRGQQAARESGRAIRSSSAGMRRRTSSSWAEVRTTRATGRRSDRHGRRLRRDLDAIYAADGADPGPPARLPGGDGHGRHCSAFLAACSPSGGGTPSAPASRRRRRVGRAARRPRPSPAASAARDSRASAVHVQLGRLRRPGQHRGVQDALRRDRLHLRHLRLERGAADQAPGRRDRPVRRRRPDRRVRRGDGRRAASSRSSTGPKIPNAAFINTTVPGVLQGRQGRINEYHLPKDWGTTGIAVRTKVVTEEVKTWKQFFEVAPQVLQARSSSSTRRATSSSAPLKALGYSLNSVDPGELEQARKLLMDLAPHVLALDSDTYDEQLASEEAVLGLVWTGGVADLREEEETKDTEYQIPRTGRCTGWIPGSSSPTRPIPRRRTPSSTSSTSRRSRPRRPRPTATPRRTTRQEARRARRSSTTRRSSSRRRCSTRPARGRPGRLHRPEPGRDLGGVQVEHRRLIRPFPTPGRPMTS